MSVAVRVEKRILNVRIDGPVDVEAVHAIGACISAAVAEKSDKLAVLAVFEGGIHRPDEHAKQAMRAHRELIRSAVDGVHVVLPRGLLGGLGLLLGKALRQFRPNADVAFYKTEADARQGLRARGYQA